MKTQSISIKCCCGLGFHDVVLDVSPSGTITVAFNPCDSLPAAIQRLNDSVCHGAIDRAIEAVQLKLALDDYSTNSIIFLIEDEILSRVSTTRRVDIQLIHSDSSISSQSMIAMFAWIRRFRHPWTIFADKLKSIIEARLSNSELRELDTSSLRMLLKAREIEDWLVLELLTEARRRDCHVDDNLLVKMYGRSDSIDALILAILPGEVRDYLLKPKRQRPS